MLASIRNHPIGRILPRRYLLGKECRFALKRFYFACRKALWRVSGLSEEVAKAYEAFESRDWVLVQSLLAPFVGSNPAPKSSWLYTMLAEGYWQQGRFEHAYSVVHRWMSVRSARSSRRSRLARQQLKAQIEAERSPLALHGLIDGAERRAPADVYFMISHHCREEGRHDHSQALVKAGLAKYPYDFGLQIAEVTSAIERGDWVLTYNHRLTKQLSREARRQMTTSLPVFAYGSLVPGNSGWATRWRDAPTKHRVLMIAPTDFAGSMYRLADALNRFSNYAVRLAVFNLHPFGYPCDLMIPECDEGRQDLFLTLAGEAGILHLKDEQTWFVEGRDYPNQSLLKSLFLSRGFSGTPRVYTHYGSLARRFKDDPRYRDAVRAFDARIAMTPDLNYDWFNGAYVPHAVDTDSIGASWSDSMVLAHSPSSRKKKSTSVLEMAIQKLEKYHGDAWRGWSLDVIEDVSHAECMVRKSNSSLFFDQAGGQDIRNDDRYSYVGWYSNSGVEAMAFGIPTIAALSDTAREGARRSGVRLCDLPVLDTDLSVEGLTSVILGYVELSPGERRSLSERTREFAIGFHGYRSVAARMAAVYDRMLQR